MKGKILGKQIEGYIIVTCRKYFYTDEELKEELGKNLNPEEEYTREEILKIVVDLTTIDGKRKPELRKYESRKIYNSYNSNIEGR